MHRIYSAAIIGLLLSASPLAAQTNCFRLPDGGMQCDNGLVTRPLPGGGFERSDGVVTRPLPGGGVQIDTSGADRDRPGRICIRDVYGRCAN